MTNFVNLLSLMFAFQLGRSCYATWNFFDAQLYIPFFDYLWKFDKDCQVRCHRVSIKCLFPASPYSVCRDLRFMHECCEQFKSTTTTPSTTTSTEDPLMDMCAPTPPEMCQPEPGCSYSPFWKQWLQQPGCEHNCWKHCFDPCACKTAANGNCEYHSSSGMCMGRQTCGEMSFKEGECRRANSFYSVGGVLCHNRESAQTNCENGTTIFAVNINGEAHNDKRGIFYMADKKTLYEDPYNTRMDEQISDLIQDADQNLYGSFALGKPNGMNKGQCLQYSIEVEEDGDYELSLRTIEPKDRDMGERIFSLTLNQVPVAVHVDLQTLSGGNLKPVDIVANFRIRTSSGSFGKKRFMTIKGHPSMDYESDLHVGLCISDCRLCEEYNQFDAGYVGSGISLVRF